MAIENRDGLDGKVCANPACRQWKPLNEFHPQRFLGRIPVGDGYKSRCKECLNAERRAKRASDPESEREAARAYVEANLEHIREIKRAHQKAHPEKYADADRRYKESHQEELNAKARERRQTDLEHYREIGRNSYERHREERTAYSRAYSKANRDKAAAALNRRRARKYQAGGSHTIQEWEALMTFYDFTCLCCGKREPEIELTRDHVISLEQDGSDSITNIQPLCARCNSKKNTKCTDYRLHWSDH